MAALIGALRVSLSADTAAFQQGMKRAKSQAKSSASSIQRSLGLVKAGFASFVAGISIGAITQGIKASLDYAGSLGEVAQQLGVTTKQLQVYRYAAGQVGVSQEQLEKGLQKLNISLGAAKLGAKASVEPFAVLSKLIGKDIVASSAQAGDALPLVADALSKITDSSQRAKIEMLLFGRAGAQLDNLLSGGSAQLNELAAAAEELGIVLSDEQIRNADQTADKLDALMTVLKAKIAGDVADNTDSIFGFIDALFDLVKAAEAARDAIISFQRNYNLPAIFSGSAFGFGKAGKSVTTELGTGGTALALARKLGLKVAGEGGAVGSTVPQFLKSGGGGGSKRPKRAPRDTSLRDAFQFEEEQRRLDMDILRAKQDIASDFVERYRLSVEMLNLEKQSFEASLEYQVKAKELTQAQADAQRLKFEEVDRLRRQAALDEEEERRTAEANRLSDHDYELQLEKLELQADLAETSRDRRAAELRILDLAHREERERLERIIRESKDWEEIEKARRELLELTERQSLERAGVTNRTRGPLESFRAEFGDIGEELEQLKVNGIMGAADALTQLTNGWGSFKDAALQAIQAVLQELIRLQLMKLAVNLLGSAAGKPAGASGSPFSNPVMGFASGGFTGNISRHKIAGLVHGQEGVLNTRGLTTLGVPNLNALNRGAPLSTVSNDNHSTGDLHVHIAPPRGMTQQEARRTGWAAGRGARERLGNNVRGRG